MKRVMFALVAAALFAGAAHAQTVATDGQSMRGIVQPVLTGGVVRADSSSKAVTMSSTGGLSIYDESRDRNNYQLFDAISNAALTTAGDSSIVLPVYPYRYLKLLVKGVPAGGGVGLITRVAFQFRECANGLTDSSSTFAEYAYGQQPALGISGTVADTANAGHLIAGSGTAPWSGEYVLTFNGGRNAPGSGVAATAFSYPNGMSIPLDSMFGRSARFAQLQVRARVVTGPNINLTARILGFSQ